MKFTKTMTANLEKLMKRHNLSDDDLQLLGEVLTEAYETGLKDCMADYEKAKKEVL